MSWIGKLNIHLALFFPGSLGVPCLCGLLLFPFESWILRVVDPTPYPWEWWDARLLSCGRRALEHHWVTLLTT